MLPERVYSYSNGSIRLTGISRIDWRSALGIVSHCFVKRLSKSINQTDVQTPDNGIHTRLAVLLKGQNETAAVTISRAVELALAAHQGQQRQSGEPYYQHALAVAEILNDLNLDYETLAAAMLHDVVEDTEVTLDDVREEFGPVIARMVDGVTKMERIGELQKADESSDQNQAENLRKLLLAMTEREVQDTATQWLWFYNHERPNKANGGLPPKHMLAAA